MGLLDGLLGSSFDDPKTAATLQLAQGLLGSPNLLQGATSGLQGYQQAIQMAKQKALEQQMEAARVQTAQLQLQQQQAEQRRQQAMQGLLPQFSQTPQQQALAAGGAGPTNTALATSKTMPGGFDFQGYAKALAGIDPMESIRMQAALTKETPKVKEFREVSTPQGVQIVGFDEYGKPVQTGQTPFKASELVDMGGAKYARDPMTGAMQLVGNKGMTPGEAAANSLGRDRLALDRSQAQNAVTYQQDADGNFVALPTHAAGGLVRGAAVAAPGSGMLPLQGKGAGLSEDQAKATGWLVQAENAFKNMNAAAKSTPGAERPGFNDALAGVPSFGLTGGLANAMRGADRQKFMQASSSLSEALLRAATGAGVNKDEAAQKIRELTPVFGDDEATIKQKMDSIPLYIESLKIRAGAGARKAGGLFTPTASPTGASPGGFNPNDPLRLR